MTESHAPLFAPVVLPCGTRVLLRPIRRGDAVWLEKGLHRLAPENRVRRFFYDKAAFSAEELRRLTTLSEADHVALVAAILGERGEEIDVVAVARCFRDAADPALAEVAITTVDEWQRLGLGTLLVRSLAAYAWAVGIRRWQAVFFTENEAPLKLLSLVGAKESERPIDAGVAEAIYLLRPPA